MRYQDITFVDFQFSHIVYEIEDVNNGMLIQRQRFELAIKPLGQCVVTGARCCLIYACAVSEPLISSHFEVIFSSLWYNLARVQRDTAIRTRDRCIVIRHSTWEFYEFTTLKVPLK